MIPFIRWKRAPFGEQTKTRRSMGIFSAFKKYPVQSGKTIRIHAVFNAIQSLAGNVDRDARLG